jgi:hypothetical protein
VLITAVCGAGAAIEAALEGQTVLTGTSPQNTPLQGSVEPGRLEGREAQIQRVPILNITLWPLNFAC